MSAPVSAAKLHDGLAQQLFAAGLEVHELIHLPDLGPQARAAVDRLAARIDDAERELRDLLLGALAERADTVGDAADDPDSERLSDLLAAAAEGFRATSALQLSLELASDDSGPEPDAAGARLLLRTAREGLCNVAKHARATRARLVLRREGGHCIVEVHDDGAGEAATVTDRMIAARSFGLAGLAREASRLGGSASVSTAPDLGGLRLSVTIPIG